MDVGFVLGDSGWLRTRRLMAGKTLGGQEANVSVVLRQTSSLRPCPPGAFDDLRYDDWGGAIVKTM